MLAGISIVPADAPDLNRFAFPQVAPLFPTFPLVSDVFPGPTIVPKKPPTLSTTL